MSLVNKMLRDLDARRAGDAERGALPAAVTSLEEAPTISRSRIAALLVLAVLAAAGVAGYIGSLPSLEAPNLPTLPTLPELPGKKVPPAAPLEPLAVTVPPAPEAAPSSTAPAPAQSGVTSAGHLRPDGLPVSPAPTVGASLLLKLDVDLERLPDPTMRPPTSRPVAAKTDAPQSKKPPVVGNKPLAAAKLAGAEPPPPADGHIDKQERIATPGEKAEAEFRRGQAAQRQGAVDEAATRYRAALAEQVEHVGARRTLAALQVEQRRHDEAEETLRRGMAALPAQPYWPMALARLKVERNDVPAALDLLLTQSAAGAASAEFQGFTAALLNRQARYKESAERYEAATRLAPTEARWWAGLGIALEASGRAAEARPAYQRARSLPGLPADLAAHVEQRLR